MTPPKKLYKYCGINANSLRAVLRGRVFHSRPVEFNDPLDCNPSLELDIPASRLVQLLRAMMKERGHSKADIQTEIDRIAYFATDIENSEDDEAYDKQFSYQLGEEIMRLLRLEYGLKGVLSLSENWNEPLLWSHYAAQHQGMCIEYDTARFERSNLRPVDYDAPRSVRAQDLHEWKRDSSLVAAKRVFDTYFLNKAPQWSYEREWRDIADKAGQNHSEFDVTAIYFGMRADFVWKWLLVKTLNLDQQVALYDVVPDSMTFDLIRREIDRGELESRGIEQPLFRIFSGFSDLGLDDLSTGERAVKAPKT